MSKDGGHPREGARRRVDGARPRRGFSLVELVMVIAIIGVLAAIAVPRLSRSAAAAGESGLAGSLSVMRTAIDLYAVEHGGSYPALATFSDLLTQYSNASGSKTGDRDAASGLVYGPYLRAIPPLPVGQSAGKNGVVGAVGDDGGWVYDAAKGTIKANCKPGEKDGAGKSYADY